MTRTEVQHQDGLHHIAAELWARSKLKTMMPPKTLTWLLHLPLTFTTATPLSSIGPSDGLSLPLEHHWNLD